MTAANDRRELPRLEAGLGDRAGGDADRAGDDPASALRAARVDERLPPGRVRTRDPAFCAFDAATIGGVALDDTVLATEPGRRLRTDGPDDARLLA